MRIKVHSCLAGSRHISTIPPGTPDAACTEGQNGYSVSRWPFAHALSAGCGALLLLLLLLAQSTGGKQCSYPLFPVRCHRAVSIVSAEYRRTNSLSEQIRTTTPHHTTPHHSALSKYSLPKQGSNFALLIRSMSRRPCTPYVSTYSFACNYAWLRGFTTYLRRVRRTNSKTSAYLHRLWALCTKDDSKEWLDIREIFAFGPDVPYRVYNNENK